MKKIILLTMILCGLIFIVGCENKSNTKTETKEEVKEKEIKEPRIEYECRTGDELIEDICINRISNVPTMQYVCPAGYTNMGGSCWKTGGVLNLSKCGANHVEVNGYCYQNRLAQLTYTCALGELQGAMCIVETPYAPTTKYICEDGYVLNANKKCEKN